MSHFTTVKTKIIDKECLMQTLSALQYNYTENSTIRGYQGRIKRGDIVIKSNGNYDVGFVKSKEGQYNVVADWYGAARTIGKNRQEFVNQITQEYSVQRVVSTVQQKGYRVSARNTTEAGEIRLVVVRRGWSQ